MNVEIREATKEDEAAIILLLEGFYPHKSHWQRLFAKRLWEAEHSILGYVLCDGEKIVGFLGVIFSLVSLPNGQKHSIGNITTWYVTPIYRQHSLKLLKKALSLKEISWTNLTPSGPAVEVFTRFGFKAFATHQKLILPLSGLSRNVKIIIGNEVADYLNVEEKKIFDEHQRLKCEHVFIKSKTLSYYIILVKTYWKKIPIAKIYYVSNKNAFSKVLPHVRLKLCLALRVACLFVEDIYLERFSGMGVFTVPLAQPRLYKSTLLAADQIPFLRSELLVLGI